MIVEAPHMLMILAGLTYTRSEVLGRVRKFQAVLETLRGSGVEVKYPPVTQMRIHAVTRAEERIAGNLGAGADRWRIKRTYHDRRSMTLRLFRVSCEVA